MKKKKKYKTGPILSLLVILSSLYLIFAILKYNNVETLLRLIIILILLIMDGVLIFIMLKTRGKKRKNKKYRIFTYVVKILLIIMFLFLGFNLNKIASYFTKVNKKVTYSAAMVTLKSNNDIDLSSLKQKKLGIIEDVTQEDGYKLAKEIINNHELLKKNELVTYPDYDALIMALNNKEVDYIFLPAAYEDIYSTKEEYEQIIPSFKTITTSAKETTKEEAKLLSTGKEVTKPFSVLLMGIDSTTNGLKNSNSFNGDTLILVTFNPSTMTATMLSIHRDSYVPITCYSDKHENKINAAAAKGTSCAIETVENYLGIKIDYYAKINFTGLVDLVDTLGGVEVDVPYALCEQDSKRRIGEHTVYIEQGYQTLNGEQALAFARNRKQNENYCPAKYTKVYRSVELRGKNQQTIILAVLEKLKTFKDITKVYDLLDVISDNVDTNMDKDTILSFYNVAKDMMLKSNSDEVVHIQKLNIIGEGQMIYDESLKLVLWNYIPQKQSLQLVKDAMQENLGNKTQTMAKEFSFDIDEGYKETIIGEGKFSEGYTKYTVLPNFANNSLADVQEWANKNGVKLNIKYVQRSGSKENWVISMDQPVSKRVDRIPNQTVTIEVVRNGTSTNTSTNTNKVNCVTDSTNSVCSIPNFVGKTKQDIVSWASKFSNSIDVDFEEIESEQSSGTILEQSLKEGTTVKDMIDNSTTLTIKLAK